MGGCDRNNNLGDNIPVMFKPKPGLSVEFSRGYSATLHNSAKL
jgi:hypothetical protein